MESKQINCSDSSDSDSDELTTTPISVDRKFPSSPTETHDQVLVESSLNRVSDL